MKRLSIMMACMALFFGFSAVSAWAIWEGNAGIAAASEFPGKGLYARSDMFPKNTVVLIENLETGIKVRAVVTGPSGVSGLVALLSPETASALNVRSGSVSRVRISIPTVVSEKGATGVSEGEPSSAVADPDVNPAIAAGTAGAGAIPLESIAGESENPLVPLEAETGDAALAGTAADTPAAAVVAPEEGSATGAPESGLAEAGMDAESAEAGIAPVAAPAVVGETANDETVAEPALADGASPEEAVAEGGYDAIETPAADASGAYYDEPELASVEGAGSADEALPVEEDTVALVPTELNPPVGTGVPGAAAVATVAPEMTVAPTAASAADNAAAMAAIPLAGSLAKGSYYVQIASYTDPVNARKLVDSYGGKYPMIVEKVDGKLKVCIGPVKKDEYGAIIERFRSLGFKGAFGRKGQ